MTDRDSVPRLDHLRAIPRPPGLAPLPDRQGLSGDEFAVVVGVFRQVPDEQVPAGGFSLSGPLRFVGNFEYISKTIDICFIGA